MGGSLLLRLVVLCPGGLGEVVQAARRLIIHGTRDFTAPIRHAQVLAERMPDSRLLIVPDASHWVQRDEPEIVNARVLDFVRELTPP